MSNFQSKIMLGSNIQVGGGSAAQNDVEEAPDGEEEVVLNLLSINLKSLLYLGFMSIPNKHLNL